MSNYRRNAYYSVGLKSWVRLDGPQEDGEYCHTSGYTSKAEALGYYFNRIPLWDVHGMPAFLTDGEEECQNTPSV